jgi:hypothetical protein
MGVKKAPQTVASNWRRHLSQLVDIQVYRTIHPTKVGICLLLEILSKGKNVSCIVPRNASTSIISRNGMEPLMWIIYFLSINARVLINLTGKRRTAFGAWTRNTFLLKLPSHMLHQVVRDSITGIIYLFILIEKLVNTATSDEVPIESLFVIFNILWTKPQRNEILETRKDCATHSRYHLLLPV